jgi:hypothetical protein
MSSSTPRLQPIINQTSLDTRAVWVRPALSHLEANEASATNSTPYGTDGHNYKS